MNRQRSYRLGPSDERDVRWGLSQDAKGDVGLRSGFGAFLNVMLLRAKLKPAPWPTSTYDGDGKLIFPNAQNIQYNVKTETRTLLTYEMSEEVMRAGSEFSRIWGALEEVGEHHLFALWLRYGGRQLGGLEAFDDLGALVLFTKAAKKCHQRECGVARQSVDLVAAAQSLSRRMRGAETDDVDAVSAEVDEELATAMYLEADQRISGACRAYVKATEDGRASQRVERVRALARRNRAAN